ncbi:MAG: hypothetical protein HOV83_40135 [Catenulispora sp.]|nr:hypothetical protein [Catenulispora sp.]
MIGPCQCEHGLRPHAVQAVHAPSAGEEQGSCLLPLRRFPLMTTSTSIPALGIVSLHSEPQPMA